MKYRRHIVLAVLTAAVLCGANYFAAHSRRIGDEDLLLAARKAFFQGRGQEAEDLARQALARRPDWHDALVFAGSSAALVGRNEEAIEYLERAAAQGQHLSTKAALMAGELHETLHHASQAESLYRLVLQSETNHRDALVRLARLLNVTGRRSEAVPFLLELVRKGDCDAETLILLGDLEVPFDRQDELQEMRRSSPEDPAPLVGLARLAVARGELTEAESLLRQALQLASPPLEAYALLGTVLLERDDLAGWAQWQSSLPGGASTHPQVWLVRGMWAELHDQDRAACRCYWEALRRDPNNLAAHRRLAELLKSEGDSASYEMLAARTEVLSQLTETLGRLYPAREKLGEMPDAVEQMAAAAALCEQAGRLWEAWGWIGLILKQAPDNSHALGEFSRIGGLLTPGTPQVLMVHNPLGTINLSAYPMPRWPEVAAPPD